MFSPNSKPELALLGVLYKEEPRPQQGGRAQLLPRLVALLFVECDGGRNAGFGREGQRTTNQLRLGSSTLGISNYACAPACMVLCSVTF